MTIIRNRKIFSLVTLIASFLIFSNASYSQLDCKSMVDNYINTLDTSARPVFLSADSLPDILSTEKIMSLFSKSIQNLDSIKCFPTYIYYGLVVEKNGSISNVMICPIIDFCEDIKVIEQEKKRLINQLTNEIVKIKTNAGVLNGINVSVCKTGRIHFDPQ